MSEPRNLKLSNIISVGFNSNYSMSSSNWTPKDIIFNKVISQVGNLLSLENGKVKIGKGIRKVKVSLQCSCNALANDTFYDVIINHNSTSIASNDGKKIGDPQTWSFPIPPVLVNVSEGDTISMSCFTNSVTFNSATTQLVVEVVD